MPKDSRAKTCWSCRKSNLKAKKDSLVEYRKRDVIKKHRNTISKAWNRKNLNSVLCTKAKKRARLLKLPFSITKENINIPEYCPVLGIKLKLDNSSLLDNSPTIDKVVPELGYIKENIQVISARANRIKNNASLEELEKIVDYVRKNIKRIYEQ